MDFSEAFALWLQSVVVVPLASPPMPIDWRDIRHDVPSASWTCGHCGERVSIGAGWAGIDDGNKQATVYIRPCPHCWLPTFFGPKGEPMPHAKPGRSVASLPNDVERLYEEARRAAIARAYTATVLCCRKILLHVAVERGADEPKNFVACVQWLLEQSYLPGNAAGWVDYIRKLGNDANHEIVVMTEEQALHVLALTEQLLRNVYELPAMVPKP